MNGQQFLLAQAVFSHHLPFFRSAEVSLLLENLLNVHFWIIVGWLGGRSGGWERLRSGWGDDRVVICNYVRVLNVDIDSVACLAYR